MNMPEKFDCKVETIEPSEFDNLRISIDYDEHPDDTHINLLYTPFLQNTHNHYHIPINDAAAVRLYDWLHVYLENKGLI